MNLLWRAFFAAFGRSRKLTFRISVATGSAQMAPRLILGSSSKFRQKLWQEYFKGNTEFCAPDVDEKAIRHTDAETLTLMIANAKADALAMKMLSEDPQDDAVIVCLDQVVCCDGAMWVNTGLQPATIALRCLAFLPNART